jgi:hypothetical protein
MKKPWISAGCVDDIYAVLTLKSLQNQSEPCPEVTGLIMIDCWPHTRYDAHLEPFYLDMLPVLDLFNFKQAVSACYANDTYSFGRLSPILRDHLTKTCNIVDITDSEIFFNKNLEWKIKNWLVVGLSWQWCIHTRPMGLNSLANGVWEDFFIHPKCVLTRDLDILTDAEVRSDDLVWQKVFDLGYRLVK